MTYGWKSEAQSGFFSSPDIILGNCCPVGCKKAGTLSIWLSWLRTLSAALCSGFFSLDCLTLGSYSSATVLQRPHQHLDLKDKLDLYCITYSLFSMRKGVRKPHFTLPFTPSCFPFQIKPQQNKLLNSHHIDYSLPHKA